MVIHVPRLSPHTRPGPITARDTRAASWCVSPLVGASTAVRVGSASYFILVFGSGTTRIFSSGLISVDTVAHSGRRSTPKAVRFRGLVSNVMAIPHFHDLATATYSSYVTRLHGVKTSIILDATSFHLMD